MKSLSASQVAALRKTGLAEPVLRAGARDQEFWIMRTAAWSRSGKPQYGILYDKLVNTMRAADPAWRACHPRKGGGGRHLGGPPDLAVSTDERFPPASSWLANGLNSVSATSRIGREVNEPRAIDRLGFDVEPLGRPAFRFPGPDLVSRSGRPNASPI